MDVSWATQESEAVAEKVLRYRRDESGWKKCREGNGVSVSWRPSQEFPGNLYRGEGILCGTLEEVWDCIKPVAGGLREKWDVNVTSFEVVQSITDMLCVSRTSTPSAAMKLISPRDFVDLVLVKKYEDGTISSNGDFTDLMNVFQQPTWNTHHVPQSQVLCEDLTIHAGASVNHCQVGREVCPLKDMLEQGGEEEPWALRLEQVWREPNKTKLVTFFQTDLSGYLPQSVVDSFFPRSMAEFYPNLQKAVRKFHH
ncbi:StAR-related lipid transfer protein 5 [Microtus ochrogaster]|uniref:StAR-related lipid transfer protein 5 n=1 Tax=Microtus ochrogaster TaxID=79684 RepID=A0A8J6KLH9_MICOH|nr:StAR-related lipid transfer protein 5 [Microtus ochrogaster]